VKLSLKSIGSTLGVSESHLGRLFCQRTGTTFRDYLRAVRMLKAITLLKSSSQPVKLVASALGYSNEGNFCRDFRKVFGMSALRYRLDKLSNGR
jgi:YesN/AraC family two-component response regulator